MAEKPDQEWYEALARVVPEWGGSIFYCQQDVRNTQHLQRRVEQIADDNSLLDGVVTAAGIVQLTPAIEYKAEDVSDMLATKYTAVFMTAQAAAEAMFKYKCKGSICLIASMSGFVANKGMYSTVYNSSKDALIQLARSLAMEWSPPREDGTGNLHVNCISPGHIETPMTKKLFEAKEL